MKAESRPSNLPGLAWLQLLRLPAVFTAIADVSMGYLVADGDARRPWLWLALIVISSCMYLGGMILNDVFDDAVDRRERPERPLPSGRISRRTAAVVGGLLLAVGTGLAWPVGFASHSAAPIQFTAGPLAVALAISILLYNGIFKNTAFGPLFMGACRFLNVLLGIGVTQEAELFSSAAPWVIAGGIGMYVMGITWFAKHEAVESPRPVLFGGVLLMLLGVVLLTLLPSRSGLPAQRIRVVFANGWIWPLLLWLLTAPVWRHSLNAIMSPQSAQVQITVKQALLSLIVLDAAIALIVAGPVFAAGLLALMIPAGLLGRWIYVT